MAIAVRENLTTQVPIGVIALRRKIVQEEGQPAQDGWDETLRESVGKNDYILQQALDAFAQS